MTALLLDILVKATALLAAAALADALLARRAAAATRHLVWSLAMAALLALPFAAAALPHLLVRIPVERAAIVAVTDTLGTAPAGAVVAVLDAPAGGPAAAAAAPPARRSFAAIAMVSAAAIYFAGVLLLLARLVVEPRALRRLTRGAGEVDDDAWRTLLERSVREMTVDRPVRLLRSTREVMPLTFGTLAPTIVLPPSADAWSRDRRRAVLLHELAHVARRDCLVQRACALACAFYWPHPGVWWGARRLRLERELACDDRVLAAGAGARDYAGHLLDLAHSLGAAPAPATALGMARARQLERRLLAILDAARNRAALRRGSLGAAIAAAAVVFVSMAIVRAAIVPADARDARLDATLEAAPLTASLAQEDATGTWELRRTSDPAIVQIDIRTAHGSHGRSIRLDRLAGLPVDQIDGANAPVHFPIRREAGTFTVDGVCRRGVCAGTYAFQADPAFADAMVKRGIGRPTPQEQFSLAMADVGSAYLDALAAAGYARPDVAALVHAAQHGVDIDYLRGMTALDYHAGSLDALVGLRDHGVDPEYIRGMQTAGYARLSADELRTARDHGVDPEYARAMAALGFPGLTLTDLINGRDHGVDPEYIRGMQALGQRLTLEEYRRTRDHGIDPEYIRGMQALGFGLTLDEYLEARNHGVDPEYARGMASLGYTKLSVDALRAARDHGVDPEYVRGMAALGYKGLSLDDAIRLRDHGVDPEYVRRVQPSGAPHLSVDEIIQRRDRGEPDPDAVVHAAAARIGAAWRTINAWLRG